MRHAGTGLDAPPAESLQIDPPLAIEAHAFMPQECALLVVPARGAPTDFPLRVDHSMPGDIPRAGAECPSDRTRAPGHAQRAGDHPVAYHTTARDRPHNRINAAEDRGSSRLVRGPSAASHKFAARGVRVSPPRVGRRACLRAFSIWGRGMPTEPTPALCIAASNARFAESPHGPHSPIIAELRRRCTRGWARRGRDLVLADGIWPCHPRSCEKSSSQNSWARRPGSPRCSRSRSRSSTRRIFPETVLGSAKNSKRRMRL